MRQDGIFGIFSGPKASLVMLKGKTILLFDDDPDDLELLEEAFLNLYPEANLHSVSEERDFWRCLDAFACQKLPHLIILDFNIPGKTGADVLLQLRRLPQFRSTPVFIGSTSSAEVNRQVSVQNGALRYFVNPYNFDSVLEQAAQMAKFCL